MNATASSSFFVKSMKMESFFSNPFGFLRRCFCSKKKESPPSSDISFDSVVSHAVESNPVPDDEQASKQKSVRPVHKTKSNEPFLQKVLDSYPDKESLPILEHTSDAALFCETCENLSKQTIAEETKQKEEEEKAPKVRKRNRKKSKKKEEKKRALVQLDNSADANLFFDAVNSLSHASSKSLLASKHSGSDESFDAACKLGSYLPKKKLPKQTDIKPQPTNQKSVQKESVSQEETLLWNISQAKTRVLEGDAKHDIFEAESVQDTDDAALFAKAAQGVVPLSGSKKVFVQKEHKQVPVQQENLADLLEGAYSFQLVCRDEYIEGHIESLDALTIAKLQAGGFSPEAHIDLHGCTVAQAYEALHVFVRESWYKGLRTILVISGRGHNSLGGRSVLRSHLATWFTQDPFKRVILAFCTAKPSDGGPGSIYVLMRKNKKKGRISWNTVPFTYFS